MPDSALTEDRTREQISSQIQAAVDAKKPAKFFFII